MRSLQPVLFTKYKQNDQVKEDQIGKACSKYERRGEEETAYRISHKKETTRKT
jgi:hypothetical protein